ncbi:MAG: cation:proton antiporter [Holosporaceae bacterium]|nr:cation:proton antiporter [Holosporaceae bacterium]
MNWTITQIASVVLCAAGTGLVFSSFGHTPVLGYIIAGILLGPSGFKFIADRETVGLFSEMGILFLLFAIGLSLSFEKIRNIWRSSITITLLSALFVYIIIFVAGYFLNLSVNQIVLITFCLTLSSTAVTVRLLGNLKDREERVEKNTFGILIAQDLAALIMALVINFLGLESEHSYQLHRLGAVLVFLLGIVFYFRKYHQYIHKFTNFIKKHEDMLTLSIFSICLGGALLAELAGLSAPFGAFIVGLILGNSNFREEVKKISSPIEEILLMTFFLSVGLLFDLKFIYDNFFLIISSLLFVTFGKTIINVFVLRICRFPLKESFVIGVLLGHIGEFSFMLSYSARKVGLIDAYGVKFLISLTALSLFCSPFWLIFAERCRALTKDVASSWEFFKLASGRELHKLHDFSNISTRLTNGLFSVVNKQIKMFFDNFFSRTKDTSKK